MDGSCVLLVALIYFLVAFVTAARGNYRMWRRGLIVQREHLFSVEDEDWFVRDQNLLDDNLAAGENPVEIERRRGELRQTLNKQRDLHDHLQPIVQSFKVRGWMDFWLAPVYGLAIAVLLLQQLICQLT